MSYKKMPPIQFIPVFESAARHLSFKLAANELCVTAPAVGQQIKAFEHWLGKPLFHRHTRHLSLTPEGKYYLDVAQNVMKAHSQGYTEYKRRFERSSLHVSAPLFVAQELIMPHYLKFSDYSPGTELRIEARMSHVDFDVEPIDAAIRFGDGKWPGLNCRQLSSASVAPVCSPSYAKEHPFSELKELHQHRLIYVSHHMENWGELFWDKGAKQTYANIICDSYWAALKAAIDGLGVALTIFPTANEWINDGRLVLPFPIKIDIKMGYWLVTPKSEHSQPEIEALYRWIKDIFDALPELNVPLTSIDLA